MCIRDSCKCGLLNAKTLGNYRLEQTPRGKAQCGAAEGDHDARAVSYTHLFVSVIVDALDLDAGVGDAGPVALPFHALVDRHENMRAAFRGAIHLSLIHI